MSDKTASWSAYMKGMFPERAVSDEQAEYAKREFEALAKRAADAGWTPEYVATLDKAGTKR